jgi:replicative DNA helicase
MTGYTDLDYKIGGMEMGDLMVISGLESSGKTSLAFNMAEHISLKENIPVGIFAVEGTNHKTVTRFLCSLAKVNYLHIKNKLMSDSDWERLTRASETMQNMRIYIDDASTIGPMTIKSTMMRMNQKHRVQVFIIDYLQKINLKSESRRIEITKIIQALKAAAEELNSIVIAISTAVRTKEARRDGSEEIVTKESGDIDYEADISLKLWRKDKAERTATVYIDKCRNGETGKVILSFLPEYTRFENYTEKQEIERY